MADSSVSVTAGTGTAIDTRTEATNGNHRQVVVLGDPATNAGVAPVDATAGLKVNLGTDNDVTVTGTVTGNIAPTTSGGLTIFRSIDLDESEEEVKATAGQVYGYFISNLASSARYIKFYNATAANVTVGTTTPVITIPLEADQAANVEFTNGIAFSTAITVAATTGLADNDTGAPGSNEVVINVFYK